MQVLTRAVAAHLHAQSRHRYGDMGDNSGLESWRLNSVIYLKNFTEFSGCELIFFSLSNSHRISHHYPIGPAYDSWAMHSAALPHVMQDISNMAMVVMHMQGVHTISIS